MSTTADQELAELRRVCVELRNERDAALADLQTRTTALAQRDSEYGERIQHQAATVDVLKAMSASPGDPQPVFDLIVQRARDICDAPAVALFEYDGELAYLRSTCGKADAGALENLKRLFPIAPSCGSPSGRAIRGTTNHPPPRHRA